MLVCVLTPLMAATQETTAPATETTAEAVRLEEKRENFGAVVAPAALPDGATAVSGWVGVPEVGAAYRQGTGGW
ncbi:hypothetical protein BO221_49415, partial [Archangium sp. Cb G35]